MPGSSGADEVVAEENPQEKEKPDGRPEQIEDEIAHPTALSVVSIDHAMILPPLSAPVVPARMGTIAPRGCGFLAWTPLVDD